MREDTEFDARERLIREAYNMRRLNADQHRNFPVLLGVDTKNMPYHLITEFEKWGDLLQFLRLSRERDLNLKPTRLVKMLIDISCALQFLQELGLVHRSVMAANVLVGDNYVCKLSGLDFLQQPTNGPPPNGIFFCELHDLYCKINIKHGWLRHPTHRVARIILKTIVLSKLLILLPSFVDVSL